MKKQNLMLTAFLLSVVLVVSLVSAFGMTGYSVKDGVEKIPELGIEKAETVEGGDSVKITTSSGESVVKNNAIFETDAGEQYQISIENRSKILGLFKRKPIINLDPVNLSEHDPFENLSKASQGSGCESKCQKIKEDVADYCVEELEGYSGDECIHMALGAYQGCMKRCTGKTSQQVAYASITGNAILAEGGSSLEECYDVCDNAYDTCIADQIPPKTCEAGKIGCRMGCKLGEPSQVATPAAKSSAINELGEKLSESEFKKSLSAEDQRYAIYDLLWNDAENIGVNPMAAAKTLQEIKTQGDSPGGNMVESYPPLTVDTGIVTMLICAESDSLWWGGHPVNDNAGNPVSLGYTSESDTSGYSCA